MPRGQRRRRAAAEGPCHGAEGPRSPPARREGARPGTACCEQRGGGGAGGGTGGRRRGGEPTCPGSQRFFLGGAAAAGEAGVPAEGQGLDAGTFLGWGWKHVGTLTFPTSQVRLGLGPHCADFDVRTQPSASPPSRGPVLSPDLLSPSLPARLQQSPFFPPEQQFSNLSPSASPRGFMQTRFWLPPRFLILWV